MFIIFFKSWYWSYKCYICTDYGNGFYELCILFVSETQTLCHNVIELSFVRNGTLKKWIIKRQCGEIWLTCHHLGHNNWARRWEMSDLPLHRQNVGVVLSELKTWIETSRFPAHFPVEVRFVKADNIYLSPCYMQDSCYINIIMYR